MADRQTVIDLYETWQKQVEMPSDLLAELDLLAGDEDAILARFGEDLDFGTGGLRGIMGVGLSRMNIYTVRRVTRALADHIKAEQKGEYSVAIGYDCRHNSRLFAVVAGCALAAAGVKAYVSPVLCPTPELSFAVRTLGCDAGIMITASHNPPAYNGYKAYNRHGGQMLEADAFDIQSRMSALTDVFAVPSMSEKEAEAAGLLKTTPPTVRATYLEEVVRQVRDERLSEQNRGNVRIIYTPLHGTGLIPVEEALRTAGYPGVHILAEQAQPDGDFPTVKSPNPEEPEALQMAIQQANETGADIVMGTDPDADRVGMAIRTKAGDMQLLTGNQVGALLVDYCAVRHTENPVKDNAARPIVFKTVVTSNFGAEIAKSQHITVEDTLTGFKYIGDKITEYEKSGQYRLLVGYEESYGYLVSPIVRDKDAVQTCLAIAEMVSYHKANGKTLIDRLEELYQTHGYYREKLMSIGLEGEDGQQRMQQVLKELRDRPLDVPGINLDFVEDYLTGVRHYTDTSKSEETITLPTSDVQKFVFEGGHWAAVRPSGTEPKMKVYVSARADSEPHCESLLHDIATAVESRVSV